MFNTYKQTKKCVSYGGWEVERLQMMEDELMQKHGYNYSQLHKVLVRDAYRALMMVG